MSTEKLTQNIKICPHAVDVPLGLICYYNILDTSDLTLLLDALKSNTPIKRVDCLGLETPSLEGLMILFQILSINKSVINVDVSPHLIDVENGVFDFSPESSTQITVKQVSSLKSVLNSFSIKKLTLMRCLFSTDAITLLSDLIRSNTLLTSVDFSFIGKSNENSFYCIGDVISSNQLSDDDFLQLISTIQANTRLKTINLSSNCIGLNGLLTVFELILSNQLTPNIQICPHLIDTSLGLIRYRNDVESIDLISLLKAVKLNLPVKRVECMALNHINGSLLNLEGLMAVFEIISINNSLLDLDISPHLIDVEKGVFSFEPESSIQLSPTELSSLKSFLTDFSIKELTLKRCILTDETLTLLTDSISFSSSLTSVDLSFIEKTKQDSYPTFTSCHSELSEADFWKLFGSIQTNTGLERINLSNNSIGFNSLLTVFELVSSCQITPNVQVLPHSIDVALGIICYENEINSDDLLSLLKILKSNVPMKRVECSGLKSLTLRELIVVSEICSINKSILDLDLNPHFISVENGVFSFSPQWFTQITTEEISSLQCLFKSFKIKELALHKCRFSENAINALCNLITTNDSLTSVDFSFIRMSEQNSYFFSNDQLSDAFFFCYNQFDHLYHKLINAIQPNHHVKKVNLSNSSIGFNSVLTIFHLVSSNKLTLNIDIFPHIIDVSLGYIRFENKIEDSDLSSLLHILKSKVPVQRVDCCLLKSLSIQGLITLFEIISINKSILDLDLSPHFINVEQGVFCFSPETVTQISSEQISSLMCFLQSFKIKRFILRQCLFFT
ncbi:hypothetical protein GEMRC1_000507 [Eukaryota sp. GEM-RC1]